MIEIEASGGDASRCTFEWEGGELVVSLERLSRDPFDANFEPLAKATLRIADAQLLRDWLVSCCP